MEKQCTKCGLTKEIAGFKKDRTKKDGCYSSCKDCNKKAWKANYPNIAERHRAKNKRYAEANPEKVKVYSRQYYLNNTEKVKANVAEWRKENKGWANSLRTIGKKRYRQAMPLWADRERINQMYIEASDKTEESGIRYEVDHIIPIKGKYVCGLHVPENLQVITRLENLQKFNRFDDSNYGE